MSRTWTSEEIKKASEQMKKQGCMSYEEFCEELNKQKGVIKMYKYGMKLRGFSIGTQPAGVKEWEDTDKSKTGFYSIIKYDRELTAEEVSEYDLVKI